MWSQSNCNTDNMPFVEAAVDDREAAEEPEPTPAQVPWALQTVMWLVHDSIGIRM